jgi:dTMP kinase
MGKLICLESLDGGGKTTQSILVKNYLTQNNLKFAYIHFPLYEANEAGKVIAAFLRGEFGGINEVDPVFVANIYAMNRFQYLPQLQRDLENNDVVLLDRYVFSNMAYQSAKYNTAVQAHIIADWINELEFGFLELPYPDLTIFFDVPIKDIKKRLKIKRDGDDRKYLKGKTDIHEADIEFQRKVRECYLALDGYQAYILVDSHSLTPEQIFDKYKKDLDRVILNKITI